MKNFIVLLLFFASYVGYTQTIAVRETNKVINLSDACYVLEDPEGKLTPEDVLKKDTVGNFQKVPGPMIYFGVNAAAFWVRCILRNETNEKLMLELGNPALHDIWLYEFDSAGLRAQQHSGNSLPFWQRPVKDVNFRFQLAVPPGATETVLLYVKNFRGVEFPLKAGTQSAFYTEGGTRKLLEGIYYGIMLVMILYNLFIYFSLKDPAYLYYVLYIFFMALWNAVIDGYAFKYFWPSVPHFNYYLDVITNFIGITGILCAIHFLHTRQHTPSLHKFLLVQLFGYGLCLLIVLSGRFLTASKLLAYISLVTALSLLIITYIIMRRGYRPARFFLIAWSLLLVSIVITELADFKVLPSNELTTNAIQIGSAVEALLLSLALANRINIYKKEKEQANRERLHSLEENRRLIEQQNVELEKNVDERTQELKRTNKELVSAMENLKAMQVQLIQKEKMASLGELTTGIAHEIQNPLNFVNNFSEVNTELVDEIKREAQSGNTQEVLQIADKIKENEQKISSHGKRADAIVKNMLQHSRISTGEKQLTDINTLVYEYLRLSYRGIQAKDKNFTAVLDTSFDEQIGKINVVPQEIGRVLLNLFNNAFYAVQEKKNLNASFEPIVSVRTKKEKDKIVITIHDNGTGISEKVLNKIFQPFFTTKPSGEGTGLGLSLSYDIITKGHGGEIKVNTKEGEYTEFIIELRLS
ncbi:MAG: ATP-binding protein [Bacteroidota bacterium]|nr:ATP-binding protein [Bacteroidota bacterium]